MNGTSELTLDELLEEPVIKLYMSSFGVRGDDVRRVMQQAGMRGRIQAKAVPALEPEPASFGI